MPHSGGGGSHSGGSHGGSSSGGSSSHGGGGSFGHRGGYGGSGSGNGPMPRIYRHPQGRNYHYIYFNPARSCYESYYYQGMSIPPVYPGEVLQALGSKVISLIFTLVFIIAIFGNYFTVFFPQKLDSNYAVSTQVTVDDQVGIISSPEELEKELDHFKEKTGIPTYVEIIKDSDWNNDYRTLQSKAKAEYLELFADEAHFLVIVSIPDEEAEAVAAGHKLSSDTDWKWEDMFGDDLYDTLNATSENKFIDIFQTSMENLGTTDCGEAIIDAFQQYEKVVMMPQISWTVYVLAALALAYMLYYTCTEVSQYRWMKKCANAKIAPHDSVEAVCPNCGLKYYTGTTQVCPKCGNYLPQ